MSNQSYHIERNKLIEDHMNLVHWVINNLFSVRTQELREELTSIGYEALVKAAHNFDPELGKFKTHAVKRIRYAILDYFSKERRRAEIVRFMSLDKQIDEDDNRSTTYHEIYEDETARYEESTVSQMYVDHLLSCLGKRDRRFISLHLGLSEESEPLTLLKLSKRYRTSYRKTSARRKEIFAKLREVSFPERTAL